MPGIAGIITHRPSTECQSLVVAMTSRMKHERFYESGTCFMPDMGVYGGWVAHQGSYAARQSRACTAGAITTLFSGECFDSAAGSTEDLRNQYSAKGDGFVARLNGLFSGLLIDGRQKRVLLFNDRYGVERLYFHQTTDALYFASEAKALLHVLPALRGFDDDGVAEYLTFGCPIGGRTLFRGIRVMEGGSLWSFQGDTWQRCRYFDASEWEHQAPLSNDAFQSEFDATFSRALPRYAGSQLGISLTGGLDTRMIMACLPRQKNQPVCYTFSGLKEQTLDERVAARVAASCGLEHHVLRIEDDFLSNYRSHVDRTVYITDGCFGATGAHEIYLNARARKLAEVRLTGNFGSEVLRSMSTFKPLGLDRRLFDGDVARLMDRAVSEATVAAQHPVTFAAFREIPWNLFGSLAAGKSQVTFRTPYLDNELVALAYRAPAAARRSSHAALQLVNRKNPGLARIATDRGVAAGGRGPGYAASRLFSEATFKLDYLYSEGMPGRLSALDSIAGVFARAGLLGLHKYLPFRRWFRQELAGCISETLSDPQTTRLPFWNRQALTAIGQDHIKGRRNCVREINAVLSLEAVNRLLVNA